MRSSSFFRLRVLIGALALALASVPFAALPSAAGSADVEDAQAAVDEIADRFITAESDARALDAEIDLLERRLEAIEVEVEAARAAATARAVEIYTDGGSDFFTIIDGDDVLDASRRAQLVAQANEDADAAIDRLNAVGDDLAARQNELAAAEQDHAALVESLEAEQAALEAELARVQSEYRAEQARLAEQRSSSSTTSPSGSPSSAEPSAAPRTEASPTDTPATDAPSSEPTAPPTTEPPPPKPEPTPAPPPPAGTHPHHDDPFLVCTRTRESSGNYQAENPNGLYFGAYQFHQQTWNGAASYAGRPELIGVVPSHASVYDQDDMAWTLYQWQGKAPWLNLC